VSSPPPPTYIEIEVVKKTTQYHLLYIAHVPFGVGVYQTNHGCEDAAT
jgi:hypothetical protein